MTIFDIPIRGSGEGFNIPNEVGLHELDGFVTVIQLLLELRFLGSQVLVVVMGLRFRSNDQSIDDGPVGVSREVVTCNGAMD